MTIAAHERLKKMDVSADLNRLVEQFLRAAARDGKAFDPSVFERAMSAVERAGLSRDDSEFMRSLVRRFAHGGRRSGVEWSDMAQAMRVLARTEYGLRSLLAHDRMDFAPAEDMETRFAELGRLLGIREPATERETREKRHRVVLDVIKKRPGMYIKEFYDYLQRTRAVRVTYATVWGDVKQLEQRKQIMTVGGPQGNPRYCFPHPSSINRRAYYTSLYCAEGVIEEGLTQRFEPRKRFLDVFLLNSTSEPVFLVVKYGAISPGLVGSRVRTFGRLYEFDALSQREGLQPAAGIEHHDMLSALDIAALSKAGDRTVWYDRDAFAGLSLYQSQVVEAT